MMHAVTDIRRKGLALGAALLALGTFTVAGAQPAAAAPASTTITRAILNKQNATPSFQAPNRVLDDDGDNLPNATPDGRGGFLFYKGNLGRGAIYAHTRSGITRAQTVYGLILASWESRGWENGAGYPINDEHTPTFAERQICPAARVQSFRRLSDSVVRMACYLPDSGVPFQVAWTG
jgi:hypothetical protein